MNRVPLIYIAGPMRRYEHNNFAAFDKAAAALREAGFRVVSPADLDREYGYKSIKEAMSRDITVLLSCDGVLLLSGWMDSLGATAEYAVAKSVAMPVFRDLDEVTTWRDLGGVE